FNPVTVNRYLKFSLVSPNEVRLAYTVMYGAGPALRERKLADINADGRLDAAETRALGERLAGDLTRALELAVDGRRFEPRFDPPEVGLAGAEVGPNPFSIDLIAHLSLGTAAEHTVGYDDPTPVPELGETEVRIEEGPTTRLIASHRSAQGTERET